MDNSIRIYDYSTKDSEHVYVAVGFREDSDEVISVHRSETGARQAAKLAYEADRSVRGFRAVYVAKYDVEE